MVLASFVVFGMLAHLNILLDSVLSPSTLFDYKHHNTSLKYFVLVFEFGIHMCCPLVVALVVIVRQKRYHVLLSDLFPLWKHFILNASGRYHICATGLFPGRRTQAVKGFWIPKQNSKSHFHRRKFWIDRFSCHRIIGSWFVVESSRLSVCCLSVCCLSVFIIPRLSKLLYQVRHVCLNWKKLKSELLVTSVWIEKN